MPGLLGVPVPANIVFGSTGSMAMLHTMDPVIGVSSRRHFPPPVSTTVTFAPVACAVWVQPALSSSPQAKLGLLLTAGEDELRAVRWSEIAIVLQSALNALNPVRTIGAQFDELLATHRPELDRASRRDRAGDLLELVGMTADRLRSYPHEMSGGMRQRSMIAMALALDPQVMILDEPTTALDVVTQREILEELMGLRDRLGFAALFITHDLSLLGEFADDIAVMYAGRLMERAPAASLFRAPRVPYTYGLLHCFPPMHGERYRLEGISGSPPDLRDLPPGCAFHPRCQWAMPQCRQDVPKLEPVAGSPREVACWLHRGTATAPPELMLPDPFAARLSTAPVIETSGERAG